MGGKGSPPASRPAYGSAGLLQGAFDEKPQPLFQMATIWATQRRWQLGK
jgi:hypothetical protein